MALTKGGFSSGPDKHIIPGRAVGPEGTGDYGSNAGSPVPASDADAQAKAVYGNPPDGTRMHRMTDIAAIAAAASQGGIPGSSHGGEQFCEGQPWKSTSGNDGDDSNGFGPNAVGYPQAKGGPVPGSPGFPGIPYDITSQGREIPTKTQGGGAEKSVGRSVKVSGNAGKNPSAPGSPGFPCLP